MSTIVCNNCDAEIEVTAALQKQIENQIEAQVLASVREAHANELEQAVLVIKAESEAAATKERQSTKELASKKLEGEKELLAEQSRVELELAKQRLEQASANVQKRQAAQTEMLIKSLREEAENQKQSIEDEKQNSQGLRGQLTELMKAFRDEKRGRENAEIEAQKKLVVEEGKIRQEASRSADEKYRLKLAEQEKQLNDTKKALETAQRKAAQGSQQNQGEVLELDLENRLREEFPFDEIIEVKKGARGADVKQVVRNQLGIACGILLWETKNGKWQPAWVAKFKADIREAGASVGVIVSQEIPTEIGDLKHLDGNVWVVTPRLATRLAAALRITILQVDGANKMNAGKDVKMEALYQFLVGPEFRHRVEAIVENYSTLQDEIEREKRASVLKWARQEKAIRAVIDNTIGMYGDLQGITNRALPTIKTLELDIGDDDSHEDEFAESTTTAVSATNADASNPKLL